MYIQQQPLISFDEIMQLQPETRLEKIFSTIDLAPLIENLPLSQWGRNGFAMGPKIKALLAMKLEGIATFTELYKRLKQDPVFRFSCGFRVAEMPPSPSTFSRLLKTISENDALEPYFKELVETLRENQIIEDKYDAIDSTKLEARERAKPKKEIDNNPKTPDWGSKFDSHRNKITWFGWKLHMVVDCLSELPVSLKLTPASYSDGSQALPLIEDTTASLDEEEYPKYWIMDAGYDYKEIYQQLYYNYNSQGIIPLNLRNSKIPPAGFDFYGNPVCSGGYEMVYWGTENGCNKFRCPHALKKVDCPHGSNWCSSSNYGLVVKTKVKDDPRLFTTPHRKSRNWKKIYNKRTAVERCFGRLKDHLSLEKLNVRGYKKAKTHVLLSCIAMLSTALV